MTVKIAPARKLPLNVEDFSAEVNGDTTQLEWKPVASPNLSYYQIRHSVATSNAIWSDATTVVAKVSRPANSISVPARSGSYMIKAYTKGGKPSADYSIAVVPTANVNSYSQSLTQAEAPSFSGSKIGLTVANNKLYATDGGTVQNLIAYDFSNYIQTHDSTVRLVNIRIDATTVRKDLTNGLFDALPNLFDDLPTGIVYSSDYTSQTYTNTGFDFVHNKTNHNDTNLLFQVSTTNDDPAGSPTWSSYNFFRAGQFSGRAFRFSVYFNSTSQGFSAEVSALTAYVEYNT